MTLLHIKLLSAEELCRMIVWQIDFTSLFAYKKTMVLLFLVNNIYLSTK